MSRFSQSRRRLRFFGALVLAAGLIYLGPVAAPSLAGVDYPISIKEACETEHEKAATVILVGPEDAYSWRCQVGHSLMHLHLDWFCKRKFSATSEAKFIRFEDPDSWVCRVMP